jgi:hypothetical protein
LANGPRYPKPWKSGPKDYKRGPGPTGAARLERRVHRLALDAARLARKHDHDQGYASRLLECLAGFVAEEG